MWYFSWILGLLLACSLGIINVLRLEAQEMLERENVTLDPLTHLLDKNAFTERLRQKIENSKRNGFPFALIFLSLSPLKKEHPNLSQSDMDSIMWGVVDVMKQELRLELDIVSRFGFEEFSIVLPGATEKQAMEVANHIQENVKQKVRIVENVTVETLIGVSEYPKQILQMGGGISIMEEVEDLIMFTCGKFVSID
jgi:cyd operon protein YbgT